jgi:hypothetical protein
METSHRAVHSGMTSMDDDELNMATYIYIDLYFESRILIHNVMHPDSFNTDII